MLTINSNLDALFSLRQVSGSAHSLDLSLQRLSSGLRINSASDDAAGLAISQRMSSQLRGYTVAARNVNDGISLTQTAEAALSGVASDLQRIRELAVQAANATNTASDRHSLQEEVAALVSEIDRVARTTQFNGIHLLDGSFTSRNFQVGANASSDETLTMNSIVNTQAKTLGVESFRERFANFDTLTPLAPGDLIINGIAVGATVSDGISTANSDSSAIALAEAINRISNKTGVKASFISGDTSFGTTLSGSGLFGFKLNGVTITGSTSADLTERRITIAAEVNQHITETGISAYISGNTLGFNAEDGRNIEVVNLVPSDPDFSGLMAGVHSGSVRLTSNPAQAITVTGARAATMVGNELLTSTLSISRIDLGSAYWATASIDIADVAIQQVASARAKLGAFQSRLTSTSTSLQTTTENLSAARSRIQDTDFAQETAQLTRANILQQAGIAMVAQANARPASVLALLKGKRS